METTDETESSGSKMQKSKEGISLFYHRGWTRLGHIVGCGFVGLKPFLLLLKTELTLHLSLSYIHPSLVD